MTLKTERGGIVAVFADESWNMREIGVDALGNGSKEVEYDDAGPRTAGGASLRSIRLPVPGSAPVKELRSEFRLAEVVQPGTYDAFISVGDRDGTPRLALPLQEDDGHRRYRLGALAIAP